MITVKFQILSLSLSLLHIYIHIHTVYIGTYPITASQAGTIILALPSTSEGGRKGQFSSPVFGLNAMCQAGLGQVDPIRDHGLARPWAFWNGAKRVCRLLGPGRTWWTSEGRAKGSSGPVFGLNAMYVAGLEQLDLKWDHGLAHRRSGMVQSRLRLTIFGCQATD